MQTQDLHFNPTTNPFVFQATNSYMFVGSVCEETYHRVNPVLLRTASDQSTGLINPSAHKAGRAFRFANLYISNTR